MFQKIVQRKFLKSLGENLLAERYAAFAAVFASPEKQRLIRAAKEEQYQEGFLRDLFCNVLGYTIHPEPGYNLITEKRNEAVPAETSSRKLDVCVNGGSRDARKADGAIILDGKVRAVIELKGCNTTDLSKIEPQAFGYKAHNPGCRYVIISNFEKLRFYIDDASDFLEFNLFKLSRDEFSLLYLCLAFPQIAADVPAKLKQESLSREISVTDKLYADYSAFKRALFADIVARNAEKFDKLLLFRKTQKLLDRLLFVFFCEDRGLLPANALITEINKWAQLKALDAYVPLYERIKKFFRYIDTGYANDDKTYVIYAYNGGLFKADDVLDSISVSDEILLAHTARLAEYDFESEVGVDILGHIFEHSLSEIEEIQNEIGGNAAVPAVGKRKKDGVFYTPAYITKYIVENTVGKLCDEKKNALGISDEIFAEKHNKHQKAELAEKLKTYRAWLLDLKICDPACGSGAFLNAALQFLKREHALVDELTAKLFDETLVFQEVDNAILENNLYGVDINEESVEIAKLSLWLHTAQKGRKLSSLNDNIKCGNSLISDPAVAGEKAFDWEKQFPQVFGENGKSASPNGFDVIIGNPPYVQLQSMGEMSVVYSKCGYESYNKNADIYCLFYEKGFQLLRDAGTLGFIASNKWLKANYGENLRKFLVERTAPQILIDFPGVQIFPDATVDPQILIADKKPYAGKTTACVFKGKSTDIPGYVAENKTEVAFTKDAWSIQSADDQKILAQMARGNAKLKDLPIEINTGIKTGINEAFYIDEETRKRLVSEDSKSGELIKPHLRGRDIMAWNSELIGLYLINTHNGLKAKNLLPVDIENYPAIKKHLDTFWEKLAKRGDKGVTPYNLRNCAYLEEFSKPKIIYPNMTSVFPFAYDERGIIVNQKCFIITAKDEAFPLKALLAILNSELAKLWIWHNCPELGDTRREISKIYFENFPVPAISPEAQATLVALANKMLSLTADLQKVSRNFHATLRDNLGVKKITGVLDAFYDLEFPAFLRELAKQKVKIPLAEQSEWRDFLAAERSRANALRDAIAATDGEINARVRALYGV